MIQKAAQMGVSEIVRNALGYWIDLAPGDVLWVMATEDAATKGERSSVERLINMVKATPCLRRHMSSRKRKAGKAGITLLNGMDVSIGWSGSPSSLASNPRRYVILDEVAKYPWSSQGEGSPVGLAEERTKVFGRRKKIVALSTPKHEGDHVCTLYQGTVDRRRFHVPCPHCGELQPLDWKQVRWPEGDPTNAPTDPDERKRLAARVEHEQSAWIECRSCEGALRERERRGAIWDERADWRPEVEGDDEAPIPGGRRVAFRISELYHWATTTSDLVAKWLRCTDPSQLQNFWNSSLGLPYKEQASAIPEALFRRRAIHPARVVPSWALVLTSTADTQGQGNELWWRYMIRAWGPGWRSHLIDWGRADSLDELEERCLLTGFPVEGTDEADAVRANPRLLLVDIGGGASQASTVYAFAKRTPHVYAIKGEGLRKLHDPPIRTSDVEYPKGSGVMNRLHLLHSDHWKDLLADQILSDAPVLWEENESADATYAKEIASEHKVLVVSGKGRIWTWEKRSKGRRNDLWDCAYYQLAAAKIARLEDRRRAAWAVGARAGGYARRDEVGAGREGDAHHQGDARRGGGRGRLRGGERDSERGYPRRGARRGRWRIGR